MKRSNIYLLLILILAVVLRCQGLFNPLLDNHSWRQTDTASVAYNYYLSGMNIFQPRLDVLPEIRELEFHLYPYTAAILYTLFGFNEVWGRIVSILCGLGTLWFIFLLAKTYFNTSAALWAAFFYASSPTAVFYNRSFLPESMMLLCTAAGLYLLIRWSQNGKTGPLLASAGLVSCAVLIKLTSLYLAWPIGYIFWQKYSRKIFISAPVYLYGLLVLTAPILWYTYEHHLFKIASWGVSIFDIGHDKWFNKSILLNPDFYKKVWLQYLGEQHFAFTGYLFLFVGWAIDRQKEAKIFGVWMWAIFAYFLIVAMGNYVHEYYQLVVLIPGAVLVGKGIAFCLEKTVPLKNPLILMGIIAAILWLPVCGYTRSLSRMKFDITYKLAGEALARVSKKKDLALVISDGEPEVLYYGHRKGWHLDRYKYSLDWVKWYIPQGVKFVVVMGKERKELTRLPQEDRLLKRSITLKDQNTIDELKNVYVPVKETDWFWIFRTDLPKKKEATAIEAENMLPERT